MIHYLRYFNNTVVDAESTNDGDFNIVVCIDIYSDILLSVDFSARNEVINDFDKLQELRGEFFETSAHENYSCDTFLAMKFLAFAAKYNLRYSTD